MLKLLKSGSRGTLVNRWQAFLRGQGFFIDETGRFDEATESATKAFQKRHRLTVDGLVGNQTFGKAALLGLELTDFASTEADFPALPAFQPLVGNAARQAAFGPLEFVPAPTPSNREAIRITNDWRQVSLVSVNIPQLQGISGGPVDGQLWLHRKVAAQIQALWQAWEERGLLPLVLSFGGAFNPRFVRGQAARQVLSNHAFATAFDINVKWNPFGAQPATARQPGCVYPLVPVAHEFGLYWGGHFTHRDGMHFEVAKLLA